MASSSSSSLTVLQGLPELLQISREYALLGQYQTSLTYYDGFNAQLGQYLVRALRAGVFFVFVFASALVQILVPVACALESRLTQTHSASARTRLRPAPGRPPRPMWPRRLPW